MKVLHPENQAVAPIAPAVTVTPEPVTYTAEKLATEAHARNPDYPGYEAVRELYEQYLKLGRQYADLAAQVEQLKHELQAVRGSMNNG